MSSFSTKRDGAEQSGRPKPTPGPTELEMPAGFPQFAAGATGSNWIGRLGEYSVLKVLGSGGMGIVFLAEDPVLRRRVALKAMLPGVASNPDLAERFLREAQAVASIRHENVVTIYHVSEEAGVPFFVMPVLEGETLADRLKREPALPTADILRIGAGLTAGLAAAHERGIIHRDIKPANIWLETPNDQIKILDFGLARLADGGPNQTLPGSVMGTPSYMAPEQANGETVDHRSDLFSLGCVLYQMCTGISPFSESTPVATARALAIKDPPSPHSLNPTVPAKLSELIMCLLAKSKEERPSSARDVSQRLIEVSAPLGTEADGKAVSRRSKPNPQMGWNKTRICLRRLRWICLLLGLVGFAAYLTSHRTAIPPWTLGGLPGGGLKAQGAKPPGISPTTSASTPNASRLGLNERFSVFLSCGETGEPGQLIQVDSRGTVLGTIRLHEAPSGVARFRDGLILAIATPVVGAGQLVLVQSNGMTARLKLDRRFPAPIDVAYSPLSGSAIICDNDDLVLARIDTTEPARAHTILQLKLNSPTKHFPSMDVAITHDDHVLFVCSDPPGVHRLSKDSGQRLGEPLLPDAIGICADPTSERWVALTSEELVLFEGARRIKSIPLPGGCSVSPYGLISFAPDGSLFLFLNTGNGRELLLVDLDGETFLPQFIWSGMEVKNLAVEARMLWAR